MSPQASFDPGLTQQYTGPLLRTINKDGSFNVVRRGFGNVAGSVYMHLVTISWPQFLGLVAAAYLVMAGNFFLQGTMQPKQTSSR